MSVIKIDPNVENTKQALSHLHEAITQLFFTQGPTGHDAAIASHLEAADKRISKINSAEPV